MAIAGSYDPRYLFVPSHLAQKGVIPLQQKVGFETSPLNAFGRLVM